MGRFSRLLQAKGKDIMIGEETFNIKPLTGKYLGLFMEMGDSKNKDSASKELILASLKQTDETITMEDVNEIPLKDMVKIIEVISEVNELN